MLGGETCYIGAPDSIRDYMFAEDHVDAYLDVAKSEKAIGEVYNVSWGNPVTNAELAKKLSGLTRFKGKLVSDRIRQAIHNGRRLKVRRISF